MPKLNPLQKANFVTYIKEARKSPENLSFLLDNLGVQVSVDYSIDSLVRAEAVFWRCVESGMPPDLSDLDHFAHLLGQYLGECIIHHTGATWTACEDRNPLFGQPCVDGFGDERWDRIYPVDTTLNLQSLPRTKPFFPGVRDRRVLAAKLEKALAIYRRKQSQN